MADIHIAYTAYCVNDWADIMRRHMELLRDNVLARHDASVSVFAYPVAPELKSVVDVLGSACAVHALSHNMFEFPALRHLVDSPAAVNLYLHTKGASTPVGHERKPIVRRWDAYMCHYDLGMADRCMSYLSACDCCGMGFKDSPVTSGSPGFGYYSGNFWWASGSHLRRLRSSRMLRTPVDRYDAERLIGGVHGSFASLWQPRVACWADTDQGELPLEPQVITV